MSQSVLIQTILTAVVRRGFTWLGLSAQATDQDVAQVVGWLFIAGNEGWQIYKAHQAAKDKLGLVKVTSGG